MASGLNLKETVRRDALDARGMFQGSGDLPTWVTGLISAAGRGEAFATASVSSKTLQCLYETLAKAILCVLVLVYHEIGKGELTLSTLESRWR